MGLLDKVQDKLSSNKNHDNTTQAHNQGMVAGSQPQAHNPNAIPAAGGQTVGAGYNDPSVGNTGYNNPNVGNTGYNNPNVGPGGNTGYNNAGVHQTAGDKMQNALPGQHGNAHDAHGNPVDLSGPGHNTHAGGLGGSNTHNTHGSGLTGNNTHNTHGAGFAGSNTHNNPNVGGPGGNTYNNPGVHQTAGDKMQNALPGQQGNAHDAHGNPIDLSGPGHNTHATHNTHNSNTLTGTGAHNTHNTHTGPDNRGMMDKAKDALSSKRTNQPDDPVTGTNYDQKNPNTHTGGVTGGSHGNTHGTHNSNTHAGGLTGTGAHNTHNTHSNNTHAGGLTGTGAHNTHGNTHNAGPDNRGMMDKAKDMLSSKRSNQPDDPVTGTNFDQKNAGGVGHAGPGVGHTGPGVGQQGVGHNAGYGGNTGGAYNAPGSGPAPNY